MLRRMGAASGPPGPDTDRVERLRAICLSLPEAYEKLSHGEPTWFVRKSFDSLATAHHDRLAFWCPAPPGVQEELVEQEPDRFFRPPYVGPSGWIGVWFDGDDVDWDEIREIVVDAYRHVAPKKLIKLLDG